MRFNNRTMPYHDKATSTLFAYHETLAHMVQAVIVNDKIFAGMLPRCMGLTTVHGPEQFQSEGLAQTITLFLETEDTRCALTAAACEMYIYSQMVIKNNAGIMINSASAIDECTDYIMNHMPYLHGSEVAHCLINKASNPQFRCYEHVYGASAAFFKKVAFF